MRICGLTAFLNQIIDNNRRSVADAAKTFTAALILVNNPRTFFGWNGNLFRIETKTLDL